MDPTPKLIETMEKLPRAGQVALGCVAVEHIFDIYKLGNVKLQMKDVKTTSKAPKDKDLVELSLELAWSFVTTGKHDAATAKAIAKMLKARPKVRESDTISVASSGVLFGVEDTLTAIEDKTTRSAEFALLRSAGGVFKLVDDIDRKDEDAAAAQKYAEIGWQHKVATLLHAHGDKPIARAMFDGLLKEELPWRKYLSEYAAKWSSQGDAAGFEAPGPKKLATKSKPAAKAKKATRRG